MEKGPLFNPEYSYLEDPDILHVQKLIDSIIDSSVHKKESLDEKQERIVALERQWDAVEKACLHDPGRSRSFLRFATQNLRMMSIGGMNMGRSLIGNFIDKKVRSLGPHFDENDDLFFH